MDLIPPSGALQDKLKQSALIQAIQTADVCIFYQTPNLIHQWAENIPWFLQDKWQVNCHDDDFLPIHFIEDVKTIKQQVLKTGKMLNIDVPFEDNHKHVIWYKFSINCQHDENDKIIGLITTGVNITELNQREQILKILLREVSHRSKNLLAIIQSIASQTARFSGNVQDFLSKFQGRIQSLSRAQDLVTDSDWRGAHLQTLIRSQTTSYIGNENKRLSIEGENPYLFPNATLHIGLAFHELITNSLRYGALSQPDGHIKIIINMQKNEPEPTRLRIHWQEVFDASSPVEPQGASCFGSAMLEKIVPTAVNGLAQYTFNDKELNYELLLPDMHFDLYN